LRRDVTRPFGPRDSHRREASWCRTPEGGSTIISPKGRDVTRPEGTAWQSKVLIFLKFFEIFWFFWFYSLANGQSLVRESGPFVRYSSKH
jgi:hypothetical protein